MSPRSDLDERRDFMLSAEKQPHPSAFVRQAPGRKSAVEQEGRLDAQRVSLLGVVRGADPARFQVVVVLL